ncbi:hypothetical protein GUJ93_ZPchr0006g44704 [Zizania palustris]|uniref:Uncharacterized protein n=1 Tax=Zizania palustris TaxID=103762 RepID=A0A8J5T667_ZIZPA|nr:hypothetical protein GUJ93_ZPchr0006g44704 [Zizania palustris]
MTAATAVFVFLLALLFLSPPCNFVNYGSTPILLAVPPILLIGSGNSGSPSDDPFQWRRGTSGGGGGLFGDS